MLEALIFDFDGVLVDSEKLHYEAFNRILTRFNYQLSICDYYDKFLGLSDLELLQVVNKEGKLSLSNQQFGNVLEEKAKLFKDLATTEAGIIEGVPVFLKMLADKKVPAGIYSGSLLTEIEMILNGAGLREFFEVVVSAEQVKRGKPDPEGFSLALKLLNKKLKKSIKPANCVVIEDSRWGLEAARAAGMKTVAITNTYAAEHLKPADKIIVHLNDLTFGELNSICS
jgi:beta-phosphoglucomutase